MRILFALALLFVATNAVDHKLGSYGFWGAPGVNNWYNSLFFSFGCGINFEIMYGTFYNMTQTPAVNGNPGVNYWNYGVQIWSNAQFWFNTEFLDFYTMLWSEYFNFFKIRPLVAQYRWNTDYSQGGWC